MRAWANGRRAGRGVCLVLALTMLMLMPSVARAAALPVVGQVQQGLSQTVQDTVAVAPGQVSNVLEQAPAAARRAIAKPPGGDLARRLPRSVGGVVDGVTATADQAISQVDQVAAPARAAARSAATLSNPEAAPARSGADARRPDLRERFRQAASDPTASAALARGSTARRGTSQRAAERRGDSILVAAAPAIGERRSDAGVQAHVGREHGPARPDDRRPTPQQPPPGETGAAASSFFFSTGLAVLVAVLGLGASGWRRRLPLGGVCCCPTHVTGVLERPG